MKNNFIVGIAVVAFAAVPLLASAQMYTTISGSASLATTTATTLTAVSGSGSFSASAVATPIMMGPGPVCLPFTRSLALGSTGSDVSTLQSFLSMRGYLKVSPTGYFGLLTKAAVARWQADGSVAGQGSAGTGFFGPLSRAFFTRSCWTGPGTGTTTPPIITTQGTTTFSANPQSGAAPLTVQFTSSAPQGSNVGNKVDFGDGSSGTLAFAPTCAGCNALAIVSHTYNASGTYTASLTSGNCACPSGGVCNCPMIQILATTTVTVGTPSTGTTTNTSIQQVSAPGSVTLGVGGIEEVRSSNYYFTLESLTTTAATIQPTAVGCWNSFPSDTPPQVHCMIAVVPTPPQTLTVGQSYQNNNSTITLTAISYGQATFSIH